MERKNILVSGCSRGVGLKICEVLAEDGYNVYGVSRQTSHAYQTLQEKHPGQVQFLSFDLSRPDDIRQKIFKSWISGKTPLHGLVNNAAIAYDDIITNIHLEPLRSMFEINVYSPLMLAKNTIRQMLLHGNSGSIVHISSISVHTGYKGLAMYAATKGALEAFSKNTAREWGSKGIRSNCVVAGFMETDMSSTLDNDQKTKIYNRTALKQPTSLQSVADTTAYLLSEKSSSVTGQNIFVDSGTI